MFVALDPAHPIHIAFQCSLCTWGGMIALADPSLPDEVVTQFLSCPVHRGDGETEIKKLDLRLVNKRKNSRM